MIRFCRVNPRSFRGLNSLGTGLPSLMKAVPATGSWSGVKYEMLGAALLLLWCSSSKPIEFHNSCIVYIYIYAAIKPVGYLQIFSGTLW